eukprot:TRINITY_DN8137_c0_g1_i1.p1 TRINITY_DN8137_c0_g1~~TRINITY_DN8137_c0_g1_i1.p1  ORF type:complete len:285 (-),score=57.36 TRINITY_DN8137_c0_g1_i1:81-935(-)
MMEIDDSFASNSSHYPHSNFEFQQRQHYHTGIMEQQHQPSSSSPSTTRKRKMSVEFEPQSEYERQLQGFPRNSKFQKNNRYPTTSELQGMLENITLAPSTASSHRFQTFQKEIEIVTQNVDKNGIGEMIFRDRNQRPEVWQDDKLLFMYYKELFNRWSVQGITNGPSLSSSQMMSISNSSDLNSNSEVSSPSTVNHNNRLGHIHVGTAIYIWSYMMANRCFFFDTWVEFLLKRGTQYISRDTWNLFFEFCLEFNDKSFKSYNFEACWPTLNDDFVTFYQNQHNS